MIEIFIPLSKYVKVDTTIINNGIFRLHYSITNFFLTVCCMFVAAKQYVGEPIECMCDLKIKRETINVFCWVHSTYTSVYGAKPRLDVHPGVRQITEPDEEMYHMYYQWVIFVLFIQMILFYVPHHIWKNVFEGKRMADLVSDLRGPVGDPEGRPKKKTQLVDFLMENWKSHQNYARNFFLCELWNLVNVVGQILLIDTFLNNQFSSYGMNVVKFLTTTINGDPEERRDPMGYLFPKVSKCSFKRFGPTGDVVTHDCLCVLPINIVNEKIFVFLWFWFILLSVISALSIIFRGVTMIVRPLRTFIIYRKSIFCEYQKCDYIVKRISYSDWFVLSQIGCNLEADLFNEILQDVFAKFTQVKEEPETDDKKGDNATMEFHNASPVTCRPRGLDDPAEELVYETVCS